MLETMTSFPGNTMTSFPIAWHVVDAPTSRVICEVRNLMPDPGDGSVHEASNLTILTYGGDGLWSREEDIYNPMRFAKMSLRWAGSRRSTGGSAKRARRSCDEARLAQSRSGSARSTPSSSLTTRKATG